MSASLRHNGCDTLMLGFDYELRKRGFAGNSCQIVLELAAMIDAARLEARLAELAKEHPILASRPLRFVKPRWKPTGRVPQVRLHETACDADDLLQRLFNHPLDIHRGELIRFDVIGRRIVFTWSHALMDAKSAEYFLAVAGANHLSCPVSECDWYVQRAGRAGGWRARGRLAWRELERLERFKAALPVSLGASRGSSGAAPVMRHRTVMLSAPETGAVRAEAARLCGVLGETNYHLAATLVELHRLHQRTGCATASYVVPLPVGLRPKGSRAPLFSNQVTMILHQFFPEELGNVETAAGAVKARQADYLRGNYLEAGVALGQLFRGLPLPLYMRIVRHELKGEICSLFFGDTGPVDPALETFLDAGITSLAHIPAVTVPPGVGVVFHQFGKRLRFTLVYASGVLTENEAEDFAVRLRNRLVNPDSSDDLSPRPGANE